MYLLCSRVQRLRGPNCLTDMIHDISFASDSVSACLLVSLFVCLSARISQQKAQQSQDRAMRSVL